MKTVCPKDRCNGCMLCTAVCPRGAILVEEGWKAYNAQIDNGKCARCDLCHRLCPRNRLPEFRASVEWHQGWANDATIRTGSSSGGLATALALQFVKEGGICVGCRLLKGRFAFAQATTEEEVLAFRGSKYVKSDPSGAYGLVREGLVGGRKVLFFGLPCQVAGLLAHPAISRLAPGKLVTVDLICHGSPSPKLLESFLSERKRPLASLADVTFRDKMKFRIRTDGTLTSKSPGRDLYMAAFLKFLTFTDNCYDCPFARLERVSDLTLGDSWNSELPGEERARGISLVLCQTVAGADLLHRADIHLEEVDLQKAARANLNLLQSSVAPPDRERFFRILVHTGRFSAAMRKTRPKIYYKSMLKAWLGI